MGRSASSKVYSHTQLFDWLNCRIWAGLNVDCDRMLAVSTLVVGVWKTMRYVAVNTMGMELI